MGNANNVRLYAPNYQGRIRTFGDVENFDFTKIQFLYRSIW